MTSPPIKALLIDLSGTLHVDAQVIPGAIEIVRKLRNSGMPFRFATNTTKISSRQLVEKLNQLEFNVKKQEVFTSLSACRSLVESSGLRPLLLMEPEAMEEFDTIETHNPNAVVVGLAPSKFHYAELNRAFRLIKNSRDPIPLIAVHKAKYYADKDGDLSLGPGGFVQALEFATGVTANVVGKPTQRFFELALDQLNMSQTPEHVAIIGDDVSNDLGGGAEALGLHRFLVRTGKYRTGDEEQLRGDRTRVFESVVEAIDAVLKDYPQCAVVHQ